MREDPSELPQSSDSSQQRQNRGGRVAVWLATGLGVGLVVPAPGTIGGLWGLPLTWAILQIQAPGGRLALIVAIGLMSVPICTWAARQFGQKKDPQSIVLDEIASVPIVFFAAPVINPQVWIAGYLLLRIFDISKPPPVNLLERLPAGWGIVADDMMAGIYAAVALRGLLWLDAAAGVGMLAG
jgi:phosphatidylglycerophosphatase A